MREKTSTREEYVKRLNKATDYIRENLDKEIDLTKLAEISCFSPFHFHRIFKAFIGESLGAFIVRIRVESAAHLLRHTSLSVQDVAYRVGYNAPSSLTKVFKQFYNISPVNFRKNKDYVIMRALKTNTDLIKISDPQFAILRPKTVIYQRLQGEYKTLDYKSAWIGLWGFIKQHNLFSENVEYIGIYYDDPKVTEADKLRADVCLTITKPAEPKGEIGVRTIDGGKYAVFTVTGAYNNLDVAYDVIYGQWLPESGYELRTVACFENYLDDPDRTAPENLRTAIYLPIKE